MFVVIIDITIIVILLFLGKDGKLIFGSASESITQYFPAIAVVLLAAIPIKSVTLLLSTEQQNLTDVSLKLGITLICLAALPFSLMLFSKLGLTNRYLLVCLSCVATVIVTTVVHLSMKHIGLY